MWSLARSVDVARFSLAALSALADDERAKRLQVLQLELSEALGVHAERREFFAHGYRLIDALRAIGHDLQSFDSDGEEFESWCGDYTRRGGAGLLTVTFRFPGQVEVGWSSSSGAG